MSDGVNIPKCFFYSKLVCLLRRCRCASAEGDGIVGKVDERVNEEGEVG